MPGLVSGRAGFLGYGVLSSCISGFVGPLLFSNPYGAAPSGLVCAICMHHGCGSPAWQAVTCCVVDGLLLLVEHPLAISRSDIAIVVEMYFTIGSTPRRLQDHIYGRGVGDARINYTARSSVAMSPRVASVAGIRPLKAPIVAATMKL